MDPEWLNDIQHHWERLKVGREGDNRGWDGWMASPTPWTWVWASSRSWWWTGRPGMLQSMGLQKIGHNWVTKLDITEQLNWTTSLWNLVEKIGLSSGQSFCGFITNSYIPGYQVSADSWFLDLNASVWHHLGAGLITPQIFFYNTESFPSESPGTSVTNLKKLTCLGWPPKTHWCPIPEVLSWETHCHYQIFKDHLPRSKAWRRGRWIRHGGCAQGLVWT